MRVMLCSKKNMNTKKRKLEVIFLSILLFAASMSPESYGEENLGNNKTTRLEFEIWGSIPFSQKVTEDVTVQQLLLAIRKEPKSSLQIAENTSIKLATIEALTAKLAQWDLVVKEDVEKGQWVANIPIYLKSDLRIAEEIGLKYARIEADILRSSLPETRRIYESCDIAKRFSWRDMSLIVVGAIIADLAVYDRVRFFPEYYQESLLPPLHPDGSRWGYTGYEKSKRRYQKKKWAFYQNVMRGTISLARFGYFKPSEQRQTPPRRFYRDSVYRNIFRELFAHPKTLKEIEKRSGLNSGKLKEALKELSSSNPAGVTQKNGKYSLNIPIFSSGDIKRIVEHADKVAEDIHRKVTIPCERERVEAGRKLGLRFPLAEGQLARDIALGLLVEEGLLCEVPDPPVPWSFGVWGWQGKLLLWEDVVKEKNKEQ